MALITRRSTSCPLCGEGIGAHDDIVATSQFLESGHPLFQFSDAAMHRGCFLAWKDRAEFVAAFNVRVGPMVSGSGMSHRMAEDGTLIVFAANPEDAARARAEHEARQRESERAAEVQRRMEQKYAGRARACPRCAQVFVSVQDLGACPACRWIFRASQHERA